MAPDSHFLSQILAKYKNDFSHTYTVYIIHADYEIVNNKVYQAILVQVYIQYHFALFFASFAYATLNVGGKYSIHL